MIDVNYLRGDMNGLKAAISRKKFECDLDSLVELDKKRREAISEAELARAGQKAANVEMSQLPKGSPEFLAKVAEMKELARKVKDLEAFAKGADEQFQEAFLSIPNLPHESVPDGKGEEDNQTVSTWGEVEGDFPHAVPHYDIPWFEKLIDFPRGVKVAGAGFPFYLGEMSQFVRALINFFLSEADKNGYQEVHSPIVVNSASATATGQLPDKEGQMYFDQNEEMYLIPTAEVPVTNFYRDEILSSDELPVKRCAYTPCFRREAGSWGKEVRGLNRLHQFDKVELVKWVHPENSFDELESLRNDAEGLLQKLGLPYRVLLICSGDIGFPHSKQYDLDVWAAGQKRWLEVSSCSNFTDFQARRANIRFRAEDGKPQPVHTLNGSALAIPRVLAAILENNLDSEGRIKVPDCLRTWFDKDFLSG
ncbi:MAG: serine--tRNA ligase [Opitutae bacterium]|jgi:seryl-tRNA synthetase|nr:serine--tRNA ligase [Opitutae bacterium]MBT5908687.1 serine--tRNA ligase [Opitutae bacterium]MBT6851509.1 serine--tRNA ligase [Opitutae bacterium]MBT7741162.1 serine--tRNA ligase [Opitutae bacterium]